MPRLVEIAFDVGDIGGRAGRHAVPEGGVESLDGWLAVGALHAGKPQRWSRSQLQQIANGRLHPRQ